MWVCTLLNEEFNFTWNHCQVFKKAKGEGWSVEQQGWEGVWHLKKCRTIAGGCCRGCFVGVCQYQWWRTDDSACCLPVDPNTKHIRQFHQCRAGECELACGDRTSAVIIQERIRVELLTGNERIILMNKKGVLKSSLTRFHSEPSSVYLLWPEYSPGRYQSEAGGSMTTWYLTCFKSCIMQSIMGMSVPLTSKWVTWPLI